MSDALWTEHAGETAAGSQSGSLWKDCPVSDIESTVGRGYFIDEKFTYGYPSGQYTATQVTAGAIALLASVEGGAIRFTNSTTAGYGMNQVVGTVGNILLGVGKNLWFETRIRATTLTNPLQLFTGLSTYSTAIITGAATPALATADYIGFTTVAASASTTAVILAMRDNSGTAATIPVTTLVDGTWVNLGFRVKTMPNGTLRVTIYVNNVEIPYTLTSAITAAIPDTNYLAVSTVGQSGGAAASTLDVAWRKTYVETSGG